MEINVGDILKFDGSLEEREPEGESDYEKD